MKVLFISNTSLVLNIKFNEYTNNKNNKDDKITNIKLLNTLKNLILKTKKIINPEIEFITNLGIIDFKISNVFKLIIFELIHPKIKSTIKFSTTIIEEINIGPIL